jgi:hypothetical protein
MAGFEVTLYGRFWVTPEAIGTQRLGSTQPVAPPWSIHILFVEIINELRNISVDRGAKHLRDQADFAFLT